MQIQYLGTFVCLFVYSQTLQHMYKVLTFIYFYVSVQAKYKERGTVIAEDQIVQVSNNKYNII